MKIKSFSVINIKMNFVATILLFITLTLTSKIIALSSLPSKNDNIKYTFYKSVNYDPNKGLLNFTIPTTIPEGYKFYLHVSGRIFMGDKNNGMSFHAFDKESINFTWEKGKTYSYPLTSEGLDFIEIDFGLLSNEQEKFLYEYNIHIISDGAKMLHKEV